MRNLYNGRKERPVGRYILFNDYKEIARFVNLYKDLFYIPCDGSKSKYGFYVITINEELWLAFSMFKEDWNNIEKNINFESLGRNKREWKYIG